MEKIKELMALFNKTSISSFVIGCIMVIIAYITIAAVHTNFEASSREMITKILDRVFDVLMMLLGYIWGKISTASNNDLNKE